MLYEMSSFNHHRVVILCLVLKVRLLLNVIKSVNKTLLTPSPSGSLYYISSPPPSLHFCLLSTLITFKWIGHLSVSDATRVSFENHPKTEKLEMKSSWSLMKANKVFNNWRAALETRSSSPPASRPPRAALSSYWRAVWPVFSVDQMLLGVRTASVLIWFLSAARWLREVMASWPRVHLPFTSWSSKGEHMIALMFHQSCLQPRTSC